MNNTCKQCQAPIHENYCSKCGEPVELQRIDGKYVLQEIVRVLNFDKGLLYSIRELLLRPGKSIHRFIFEDRNRLVKPLVFIILTSLIYALTERAFQFEDRYMEAGGMGDSATAEIFGWITANYGYSNILMAVFIAGWIKLFFRSYKNNIFEILILLCYVMGIGMLMYAIFGIAESLSNAPILQVGGLIGILYTSWAIGQFFDKSKKVNYIKGLVAYILGMISFFLVAMVLGLSIDSILS